MDTQRLIKRFTTLMDFGICLGRKVNEPLVLHSTRGEMNIFEVLAFEFHTNVFDVKAALSDHMKTQSASVRWAFWRAPQHRDYGRVRPRVTKQITDGDKWIGGGYLAGVHRGLARTPRQAEVSSVAIMVPKYWRSAVSIVIAQELPGWLASTDTYLELGGLRMLKQSWGTRTLWVAHEPQTYTTHFIHLPIYNHDGEPRETAPVVNVTGLEDYFVEMARWSAESAYVSSYGEYMDEPDRRYESQKMEKEWERLTVKPQSRFPGEETVNV